METVTAPERPSMPRPARSRGAWGPLAAGIVLVAAIGSVLWLHQRPVPAVGGPFTLVEANDGQVVTDRTFAGRWLLVFFGYTHCPDICPTTMSTISDALAKLGPLASQIQPLFITIDPERDTLPVLADYTAAFDPRIIGLTATPEQI